VSDEAAVKGLAAEVTESPQQPASRWTRAWFRHRALAITLACYLVGAFFVTYKLWINPAGRWQTGDIEDVDQATWFMRYTATAIEHFRLPALVTTTMNAPHSVNLLWNTSLLLPGTIVTPVTLLFGPQVSLTVLLVIAFAGSAASMYYVLRRWNASQLAAAFGGFLYGFSPALVQSGIGHYSLVLGIIPPLLVDRVLRIATGRGKPVRNGLWLGVLAAGQVFVSEEALTDAIIASVILLAVLAINRPREVLPRLRPLAIGLGTAAIVGLVLAGRAIWVQFHGVIVRDASATVTIMYNGRWTNLGILPYAFVTPSKFVLFHSVYTAYSASNYPQPTPEYLAYLGVPLIVLLLAAIVVFWRHLPVRVAGITCLALEWLGLGARQINPKAVTLPGFLLPWTYLQHLPVISGLVPDRLCIIADAAAAAVLAFSLDLARKSQGPFAKWEYGGRFAIGAVVVALLFIVPAPYSIAPVNPVPSGWKATFTALRVTPETRVLLAPFPNAATSFMVRWTATAGKPTTMIGGDFISPDEPPLESRAGRAALNPTSCYLALVSGQAPPGQLSPPCPSKLTPPTKAQIRADLAAMEPQDVVAVTTPSSPLGKFLISLFGRPTTQIGQVLGWRLPAS
jgi:hypothetical protein